SRSGLEQRVRPDGDIRQPGDSESRHSGRSSRSACHTGTSEWYDWCVDNSAADLECTRCHFLRRSIWSSECTADSPLQPEQRQLLDDCRPEHYVLLASHGTEQRWNNLGTDLDVDDEQCSVQ